MTKKVKIKGENIDIDENYYVLYKILQELVIELRRLGEK